MRLGQLARKYNISIQKIISYLDEIEQSYASHHPNSKLDEETESLVEKHFEHLLVVTSEPEDKFEAEKPKEIIQEQAEVEEPEVEIIEIDKDLEVLVNEKDILKEEVQPLEEDVVLVVPEFEAQITQEESEDSIDTERLIELMDSEEPSVDLSKIKLIKAPKKELSGLKVVGKIDLPEPKNKDTENSEDEDTKARLDRDDRKERRKISQAEREQRRLNAKKKKEEYELRQERRRKEKEKKERKAKKEAHYKQQLQRAQSNKSIIKTKYKRKKESAELENQLPKPTTLLGKFLRWLNT